MEPVVDLRSRAIGLALAVGFWAGAATILGQPVGHADSVADRDSSSSASSSAESAGTSGDRQNGADASTPAGQSETASESRSETASSETDGADVETPADVDTGSSGSSARVPTSESAHPTADDPAPAIDTAAPEVESDDAEVPTSADEETGSSGSSTRARTSESAHPRADNPVPAIDAEPDRTDLRSSAKGVELDEYRSTPTEYDDARRTDPGRSTATVALSVRNAASPVEVDPIASNPVVIIVSALMKAVGLQPSATWDPSLPADTPIGLAVLGWVWRQVERSFFNGSPVAVQSDSVSDDLTGAVTGTVTGIDPEGDPLAYRVSRGPAGGTVSMNGDGSYTYTPSARHLLTGGVDSFVVTVADVGYHLHLFNGTGATSVTVSVFTAPQGGPSTDLGYTRGFNVYNLSSKPITFVKTDGDKPDSTPPVGSVIAPGQIAHFELTYHLFKVDEVRAWFSDPDGNWYAATMKVVGTEGAKVVSCAAKVAGTCNPVTWQDAATVRLLDVPGTEIVVDPSPTPGENDEQSRILNQLCYEGSAATCTFTAERQELRSADPKQVSSVVKNEMEIPLKRTVETTDTVTNSDNLQITGKASVKVGALVNLELSVAWGHTWTTTHTYTEKLEITVPAHEMSIVYGEAPLYRNYGDFALHMGNTTWILRNVYFDSPNPTGLPVYSVRSFPIPPQDSAAA